MNIVVLEKLLIDASTLGWLRGATEAYYDIRGLLLARDRMVARLEWANTFGTITAQIACEMWLKREREFYEEFVEEVGQMNLSSREEAIQQIWHWHCYAPLQ